MEYYSAIKKNNIMAFANKWMEMKTIMLSETSQPHKTNDRKFSYMWMLKQIRRGENRNSSDYAKGNEGNGGRMRIGKAVECITFLSPYMNT